MSRKISAQNYPDHLNPFDENYHGLGVAGASTGTGREKYNTWSASRPNQVSTLTRQKPKPTFLEKPWAALNISPKGKIVRRLSILKTAVEKFASKKKRLSHSSPEGGLSPRSNSLHDEFNFKIISPKQKEKIRQQAFNTPVTKGESNAEVPRSPQPNSRFALPLRSEAMGFSAAQDTSPTSPESVKSLSLSEPRPKTRKKRPPPPPPAPKSPSLGEFEMHDK